MSIKNIAFGAAAGAFMFGSLAIPAFASTVPSNFPGNNGICNAWHGAPGGLGVNGPYYWVQNEVGDNNPLPNGTIAPSGGANFGQEQGVITGQNNSGLSATCNQ